MNKSTNNIKPIQTRGLKKVGIHLRKDYKDNWGRFLDNHYDPGIHTKPFNAAMYAPKDSYKYSSAGLSHKFVQSSILQSLDIEEKLDRTEKLIKFKEASELTEGEICVFIEYCPNNEKTQLSTNHCENKYVAFAKRFRQGIVEKFPLIKVYIKSTNDTNKVIHYKITKDPRQNFIDNQREQMRIGAFEITMVYRSDNFTRYLPIYSKLKGGSFPRMSYVLSKICGFIPKCNLMLQICDNIKDANSKLHPEKAEGMKVQLKISFKDTQAGEDLDADLREIEKERSLMKTSSRAGTSIGYRNQGIESSATSFMPKRQGSAIKSASQKKLQFTSRPYSAQTDFPSMSRNPYSRRNFSNRMMSSQQLVRPQTASQTIHNRPQTAASVNHLRSSASIGQMRTLDANLSTFSQPKKNQKKMRPKIEDLLFEATVNEHGFALFQDIPKTTCHIDASENDFFKNSRKFVNLPQELQKEDRIEIYLPVERQDAYTTTIYMSKPGGDTRKNSVKDSEDGNYTEEKDPKERFYESLSIRAVLLELYEHMINDNDSDKDSDLQSEVEYEEEFEQIEDKNGKFQYS